MWAIKLSSQTPPAFSIDSILLWIEQGRVEESELAVWNQESNSLSKAEWLHASAQLALHKGIYTQAIELAREGLLLADHNTDRRLLAFLQISGKAYMEQGFYAQASEFLGIAARETNERFPDDFQSIGEALRLLGMSQVYAGYYEEAETNLLRAAEMLQQTLPSDNAAFFKLYMAIGSLYKSLRMFDQALFFFNKALDLSRARYGEAHRTTAYAYSEAGQVHLALGQQDESFLLFQKENEAMLGADMGNHPDYGYTCVDLGRIFFEKKSYQTALFWQQTALQIFEKSSNRHSPLTATVKLYIGRTLLAQGDYEAAKNFFEEDIHILTSLYGPDYPLLFYSEAELGNVALARFYVEGDLRQLTVARTHYTRACALLKILIGQNSVPEIASKRRYDATPVFGNAIACEYLCFKHLKDPDALNRAWLLSETLHGFSVFSSSLQQSALTKQGRVTDSIAQLEQRLRKNIAALHKEMASRIDSNKDLALDSAYWAILVQLRKLKERHRLLMENLINVELDLKALANDRQVIGLSDIQRYLRSDQCLIEYFVTDTTTFAFVINNENVGFYSLGAAPLAASVQDFRQGISEYFENGVNYDSSLQKYISRAYELYRYLLHPMESMLREEVLIIPDGVLYYLPFEALLTGPCSNRYHFNTYPFLLRSRVLSYAYSASWLYKLEPSALPLTPSLLHMAPFDKAELAKFAGVSALPFSAMEMQTVAAHGRFQVKSMAGSVAGREAFLSEASKYDILHLSTHARVNNYVAANSYLLLYPDGPVAQGSRIYPADIHGLRLRARLVVLSACNTGAGHYQRGEGVLSLSRAFAHAGASHLLATLWLVNDQAGSELIKNYYEALGEGLPLNRSLTVAKRRYLTQNAGFAAHPYYWAGYTANGYPGRL